MCLMQILPLCFRWQMEWLMSSCIQVPQIRPRTEDLPLWSTSPTKQQPWPGENSSLVRVCLMVHPSNLSGWLLCFSAWLCLLCSGCLSVLFVFYICVSPDLVSHLCSTGTFQLWGQSIQVDWAEPEKDVEEEVMQRVRVLYVSEFMTEMTAEDPSSWSEKQINHAFF